jgi:hypothetical protein
MATTNTDHVTVGHLADRAAQAIRLLNHRTRPATEGLAEPGDTAEIIADLASMAAMLPQLLDQLGHWLEHQQHAGRLRVDTYAPLPDPAATVHALTDSLQHVNQCMQRAATALDTAHQHAAHLAATPGPEFTQISGAKSLDETQIPRRRQSRPPAR